MPARKRSVEASPEVATFSEDDRQKLVAVLAHLNFSGGKPDPRFLANLNAIWPRLPHQRPFEALRAALLAELDRVQGTTPVFSQVEQARAVIELTLPGCLDAYRAFHRDLLFHLQDSDYSNPFFAGRMFEAVLSQGAPWEDRDRILDAAVTRLNDYIGYRPVAVLENDRLMQVYPHEKFAPLPLYVAGAGVAETPYAPLIARTLDFLREAPQDLLQESFLDPEQIAEIVLDVRAHDHLHPVNKRTNYMFGEWDPHTIDVKGRYRRFVVRKVVLDAMTDWASAPNNKLPPAERLFDAAAALCGTMLMAASVSGSGPDTHDSTASLTNLLPVIAHRRDEFYARLTAQADGPRAKRLKKIEKDTRQPFGHVRQHLNMHLAGFGARQVQHRELALLFARIGFVEESRRHAVSIPAASLRIECEVLCELNTARRRIRDEDPRAAFERLLAVEDLLQRGIQCGALVDPWNVLGFGGQFPLFAAREDAIPDNRIESLLDLMEETFNVYGETLVDAAARGDATLGEAVSDRFQKLADWWDQFATDVIEDIPEVIGQEAWESATHVAGILGEWRRAGQGAGDVSFWRQHIERFQSAHAYGPVVSALLDKHDHVASFALMMQWLSQIDEVGTEGPQHSLLGLLIRWMKIVTRRHAESSPLDLPATIRRLFDYLEANAGSAWSVPTLQGTLEGSAQRPDPDWLGDGLDEDAQAEPDDNPFSAAFEGVTFKDSADDGNWGDTLDEDRGLQNTEFELVNREIEPRLKFLNAVGQLWQMAAAALVPASLPAPTGAHAPAPPLDPALRSSIEGWRTQCRQWESELLQLMDAVWAHTVESPTGEHNDNIEFDLQLQVKYYLLNQIVVTLISLKNAERLLAGCLPAPPAGAASAPREEDLEDNLSAVYGAVVRRDADEVARRLPLLLRQLQKHPLLYVPFDHGGTPDQILRAQTMQSVARFLLRELPRLGLLRSTWHLLNTVFKMERRWRPEGQAITEFDRLFDIALRNTLRTLVQSAEGWPEPSRSTDDLLNALGELLEPYQQLWMKHSRTMRLSSVDGVRMDEDWAQLYEFIQAYGGDLFHASQLTLGHVRAILHNGVGWYLDYLRREEDPLHPLKLIDDIDQGRIDRDDAEWCLETLYSIVVDKFDRFLEYNTTTTQSDYGQMFYTLLDFLRAEARYDREAWNLTPLVTVHDVLCRHKHLDAASLWADMFEAQTTELADRHLADLAELERRHGMRLPAISDHLNQRLCKSLKVNEMVALVRPAVEELHSSVAERPTAEQLARQVDVYLEGSWGSGIDIPAWVRALDREATDVLLTDEGGRPGAEADIALPAATITLREFRQQISVWRNSLGGPSLRRPGRTPADSASGKPPASKRPRGRKRK
jgi:hypothetical protein